METFDAVIVGAGISGSLIAKHLGLKGKPRFVDMPPLEFEVALRTAAPDVELRVLRPGEDFEL